MNRLPALAAMASVGLLASCAGGSGAGLNQTSITCPQGRTLLDGVCVAESVADYVACVRAQGAQLDGARSEQISAEAGYLGVKAGGASEVSERLQRKYAASDQAMMAIVGACNSRVGVAASAEKAASAYVFEDVNYAVQPYASLAVTAEECAAKCAVDSKCRVASMHDSTYAEPWRNKCALRGALGPRDRNPGVKSWVKGQYAFRATNFGVNPIQVVRDQTDPQACGRLCEERPDCKVASFHDATASADYRNTCVLRGSAANEKADQGVVSWVK